MTNTVFPIQPMRHPLARPLAVGALLVILVLSIGGALAERMEQRAVQDRFMIGDATGRV